MNDLFRLFFFFMSQLSVRYYVMVVVVDLTARLEGDVGGDAFAAAEADIVTSSGDCYWTVADPDPRVEDVVVAGLIGESRQGFFYRFFSFLSIVFNLQSKYHFQDFTACVEAA